MPKGPSFDPRDKRLAMRVEDHPVEYGSFEGVIPEGEYGAGAVVLWDRGTWTPVVDPNLALKKGELKFHLQGEKLAGKWALVKIKGDDPKAWLLVKDKDEHARAAAELDIVSARPESVVTGRGLAEVAAERDRLWHSKVVRPEARWIPGGPAEGDGGARLRLADLKGAVRGPLPRTQPLALAMVVETPPEGDDWLHEIKHDGYRILARIAEGEVRLISRNGKDWTKEFPQVARAIGRLRRARPSSTARSPRCCRAGRRASRPSSSAPTARRRSSTSPSTSCTSTAGTCGRSVSTTQEGAAAPPRIGAPRRALQRSRARPGRRVLRDGASGRARGRREQARQRSLSPGAWRRLAEGEVPADPGGRDRRFHAVVGRRRDHRRAARRLPRRR